MQNRVRTRAVAVSHYSSGNSESGWIQPPAKVLPNGKVPGLQYAASLPLVYTAAPAAYNNSGDNITDEIIPLGVKRTLTTIDGPNGRAVYKRAHGIDGEYNVSHRKVRYGVATSQAYYSGDTTTMYGKVHVHVRKAPLPDAFTSSDLLPLHTSSALESARQSCYSSWKNEFKPAMQGLVTALEIADITNLAKTYQKIMLLFRESPLVDGLSTSSRKRRRSLQKVGDAVGDSTLAVDFGIRPLIGEISVLAGLMESATEALKTFNQRGHEGVSQRFVRVLTDEYQTTKSGTVTRHTYKSAIYRQKAMYKYRPLDLQGFDLASEYFGLKLTSSAMWEIIPFSFLVDWFFNVGKMLSKVGALRADVADATVVESVKGNLLRIYTEDEIYSPGYLSQSRRREWTNCPLYFEQLPPQSVSVAPDPKKNWITCWAQATYYERSHIPYLPPSVFQVVSGSAPTLSFATTQKYWDSRLRDSLALALGVFSKR